MRAERAIGPESGQMDLGVLNETRVQIRTARAEQHKPDAVTRISKC